MSIEIFDVDNINSDFCSGLRGYHVYQEFWKQLVSQTIFAQGEKNSQDRFAISGSAKIPGQIGRVVVGHIS